MTVSGLTMTSASHQPGHRRERTTQKTLSVNRFLRETFLADYNRRFAIAPEEPGSAFVPFAGALDDILCVHDERRACGFVVKASALTTNPQAPQQQQKRSIDMFT